MSKESVESFLARLDQDPEFKSAFLKCTTRSEKEEYLKSKGYHFTRDELIEVFNSQAGGRELSEEELAQFAAGAIGATQGGTSWVCLSVSS